MEDNVKIRSMTSNKKLNYKQTAIIREHHSKFIYGIATNERIVKNTTSNIVFAAVGGPYISFYECLPSDKTKNIKFMHTYKDPDPTEDFYCCDWSYYVSHENREKDYYSNKNVSNEAGFQILACAGARGIVRIINGNLGGVISNLRGHGEAINELLFHRHYPDLLFTFSKDRTARLWNVWNSVLVCIFGGSDGHRDEVLYGDIDITGQLLLTCGMDHTMKIWKLDDTKVSEVIERSRLYSAYENRITLKIYQQNYPSFSTNDVHKNYVDCGRWFGRLIISKSCDNCISMWMVGDIKQDLEKAFKLDLETSPSILHQMYVEYCDLWFMRFDLDVENQLLALGNTKGIIYVWNFKDKSVSGPKGLLGLKPLRLEMTMKNESEVTIRQTRLVNNGKMILCGCDGGVIVRFDQV